jgi:dTMP kinase
LRIRESFLDQARRDPARHVVVDASGTPDEVRARTIAAFDAWTGLQTDR